MEHPKQSFKDLENFMNDPEYAVEHLKLILKDFFEFADKYYYITPPFIFFNTLWEATAQYLASKRIELKTDDVQYFSEVAKEVTAEYLQSEIDDRNKQEA